MRDEQKTAQLKQFLLHPSSLIPHPFLYGSASTLTKMRKLPPCMMPSVKWTLIELFGRSGLAIMITPAESVEFNPPPMLWLGGCSSVSPSICTGWFAEFVTSTVAEFRTRMSASLAARPPSVVTSTTRKRKRVTACPVLLVNLRRMSSVPNCAVVGLVAFASRTRAQAVAASLDVPEQLGSMSDALMVALR